MQGNKEQLSDKNRARPSFKGAVLLFHFTRRIKPPHLSTRPHDCLHKSNTAAATNLRRHKHSNSREAAEVTYAKTQRNLERNGGRRRRAGAAHQAGAKDAARVEVADRSTRLRAVHRLLTTPRGPHGSAAGFSPPARPSQG